MQEAVDIERDDSDLVTSYQNAAHSEETSEWYSPPELVDAAHEWMGSIDHDPASCAAANALAVRATTFDTEETNGLTTTWDGSVFLNPPTPPRRWWERAALMHVERRATVFYVAYSIEQLAQSQTWALPPKPTKKPRKGPPPAFAIAPMTAFSICVPRQRIRFLCFASEAATSLREILANRLRKKGEGPSRAERLLLDKYDSDPRALVRGSAPPHASAIVGVGPDHDGFARACRALGTVLRGTGRGA